MKTSQSCVARIDRAEGGTIYQVSRTRGTITIDGWLGEQRADYCFGDIRGATELVGLAPRCRSLAPHEPATTIFRPRARRGVV